MNKRIRTRSLFVCVMITCAFLFLLFKIYQIQIVDASWLQSEADKRWNHDKIIPATRGLILDRNSNVLAEDTTAYSLSLNPKLLAANHIVDEVVKGLTDILASSSNQLVRDALAAKIRDRATKCKADGTFAISVDIRNEGWKMSKPKADQVLALASQLKEKHQLRGNIGIYLTEEEGRYYPGNSLAAHVLGYLDKEGNAKLGLEAKLDDVLTGHPGKMKVKTDAMGVEVLDSRVVIRPAENGNHVRLTIDKNIQYFIENAIMNINDKFKPKSVSIVALDPSTMEVLGLANSPTFNPNAYWEIEDLRQFKNQAIASQFEPGSTFKLVTLAGALEEGMFNPDEIYDSGVIKVPGATLHDHNRVGWGKISYLEGLKRSSNVAFVKLGYEKLGPEKFLTYANKFHFGQKTNIDLQGEVSGSLDAHYPAEFATATYGQGKIVATNLQIATAYAAIANGGKMMIPYVVKDIINSNTNEVIKSNVPQGVGEVVPEPVARQVTQYLEQTVTDQTLGTGRMAYIPGYRVAGKTGTANIVDTDSKGYASGKWMVSFVGYAPADNPKILISIMVEEPDLGGNYHLAGSVTGPAFKDIAIQSLQYMGVPAQNQEGDVINRSEPTVQDTQFIGLSREAVLHKAKQLGIAVNLIGEGNDVLDQYPRSTEELANRQIIQLLTVPRSQAQFPSLQGKSKREAFEVCNFLNANCQFQGNGYVTEQKMTIIDKVKTFNLILQPLRGKVSIQP